MKDVQYPLACLHDVRLSWLLIHRVLAAKMSHLWAATCQDVPSLGKGSFIMHKFLATKMSHLWVAPAKMSHLWAGELVCCLKTSHANFNKMVIVDTRLTCAHCMEL